MASTLSPNMSLIIPAVGTEAGPTYAFDVNASLTLIDQHDHSSGRGVQITPDGLNLNATVDFLGNDITHVIGVMFDSINDPSSIPQTLSVSVGSGTGLQDLWFTDGTGTPIQITKSGAVNVTAASIPGESYSGGTFIWTQTQSALPTTPANFDIGSITLRPNTPSTTNGVTLSPPSAIASAYTLLLPNNPGLLAGTAFVTLTTSGQLEGTIQTSLGITSSMLAPDSVITSKILNANVTAAKLANDVFAAVNNWQSQTFTASGNFTVPAGVTQVFVLGAGGGGGGGPGGDGTAGDLAHQFYGGAGGNASHPVMYPATVTPAAVIPIVIGTGGAGSSTLGVPGAFGTDTTFGSLLAFKSAEGGTAGDVGGYGIYARFSDNGGGPGGGPATAGHFGYGSVYATGSSGGSAGATGGGGGGGASGWATGGNGGAGSASGANGGPGIAAAANSSAGGGGGGGSAAANNPGGGAAGGSGKLIVYWLPGAA